MAFTVVIVGRPNVGKSTLFNRLVGKKLALVDDTPGVTRDRREGLARIGDLEFRVIDTAGLDEATDDSLTARMQDQTAAALLTADLALLLIDARVGLTPLDEHFAHWLRAQPVPIRVIANKAEGKAAEAGVLEAFSLGLGEPVAISAEHGEGLADLYAAIRDHMPEDLEAESTAADGDDDRPIQLAIIGRPNVGKSTLINRLIGEDRLLTGPEAGITRDAITVEWRYRNRRFRLVDTAGMRRKARVKAKLEKLSVADGLRAMGLAQVAVLLVDAMEPLEKQELTLAARVLDEGRALVVALNKWDLATDRAAVMAEVRDRLEHSLAQGRGLPVVAFSAKTGKGLDRLMPAVLKAYEAWTTRVPTAALNRWLDDMTRRHPPPAVRGRRLRLRYMTQAKARPPTFALFASRPADLPESYLRYLVNGLRQDFGLAGVPIRVNMRKGRNPYVDER